MQKSAPASGPLWNNRADLQITLDGKQFDGMAETKLSGPVEVKLVSNVPMDRLQITSCSRQDVFENVDAGWFGGSGKTFTYTYAPSAIELKGVCPLYIEIYSKADLTAWGFVAFKTDEKLPAKVACNGIDWSFSGMSICQTKAGLEQAMSFSKPVDFEAEETCTMVQDPKDKSKFTMRPQKGFCRATFTDGVDWHRLIMLGYDQVLVRVQ